MKIARIKHYPVPFNSAFARAGVLDFPKDGELLPDSEISISGWLLRANESDPKVTLLVETETESSTVELTIDRPDVVSIVLNKKTDERLKCGFRITIAKFDRTSIYIMNRGEKLLWIEITNDQEPEERAAQRCDAIVSKLIQICRNSNKEHEDYIDELSSFSSPELSATLSEKVKSVSLGNLHNIVSQDEAPWVIAFRARLEDTETLSDWVRSATTLNRIILPDPFGPGIAECSMSLETDTRVSVLFFDSPSEPFIILQHVTYVDAVFFPKRSVLVPLQHLPEDSSLRAISDALYWLLHQGKNAIPETRQFGGAISGFGRPYHFFYDIVPALELMHKRELWKGVPYLFHSSGSLFADPNDLFSDSIKAVKVTPSELRQRVLEHREFHCRLGLPFSRISEEQNRDVEEIVREAARHKHPQPKRLHSEGLRIWWGITGQKRSWIEQEDGTAYIIDKLSEDWPNLEIVFDGWTIPTDPSANDKKEVEKDEAIVSSILSKTKFPVKAISLVGKSSLEKVAIGETCDVFVANYATGSMHVSRFANRPGVLHINSRMNKGEHRHFRSVSVPVSRIKDIAEDAGKRADFSSYSIEPDDILLLLTGIIETNNRR